MTADKNIHSDDESISRNRKTAQDAKADAKIQEGKKIPEQGGRLTSDGEDPTRFGDWEKNGKCVDF